MAAYASLWPRAYDCICGHCGVRDRSLSHAIESLATMGPVAPCLGTPRVGSRVLPPTPPHATGTGPRESARFRDFRVLNTEQGLESSEHSVKTADSGRF